MFHPKTRKHWEAVTSNIERMRSLDCRVQNEKRKRLISPGLIEQFINYVAKNNKFVKTKENSSTSNVEFNRLYI